MLYMKCPTCKSLLGNKQVYYEENFDAITKDYEMGKINHEDMENKKKKRDGKPRTDQQKMSSAGDRLSV